MQWQVTEERLLDLKVTQPGNKKYWRNKKMTKEPILDIAQLAHIEIYSPKLEESVAFFKNILGMDESYRHGNSVYMRAYEDHYHNTLIITENDEAGLGHIGWRATSPQALERRVAAIEKTGIRYRLDRG